MENLVYYASIVIAVLIGVWLVKRFVGCLVRSAIAIIIILVIAYIYFAYIM